MPVKKYYLLLIILVMASALPAQVLLDDTFTSANSDFPIGMQNPPNSAKWYLSSSGLAGIDSYTTGFPGPLTQDFSSVDQSVEAYFAAPGSQTLLGNAGDALTLNFAFTMNTVNPSSDGIRVALLNSGSTDAGLGNFQINGPTDVFDSNGNFANYTGVAAFFDPSNAKVNLYTRDSGSDNTTLIAGTNNIAYNLFGPAGPGGSGVTAGTPYLGTLTLTYQGGSSLGVSFSIYDVTDPLNPGLLVGEGSATVDSPNLFDTIALGGLNGTGDLTLSEVSVVLVPEPPVYALCGGGSRFLPLLGGGVAAVRPKWHKKMAGAFYRPVSRAGKIRSGILFFRLGPVALGVPFCACQPGS